MPTDRNRHHQSDNGSSTTSCITVLAVEDRCLDYHLMRQCSAALNSSLLYELVVVAAITLRHIEIVVPIRSENSRTPRIYVFVRLKKNVFQNW